MMALLRSPSRNDAAEAGQAMIAVIGLLAVLVLVPLTVVLLATGQMPLSQQAAYQQEALAATRSGLSDYVNLVAANMGFAPPPSPPSPPWVAVEASPSSTQETFTYRADTSNWSSPDSIGPSGGGFKSISCTSSSFCVAVKSNGNAYTFNGGSWSGPATSAGGSSVSVSCTSPSFCVAVTSTGGAYTYDGASWSGPASTGAGGSLVSVSCTSSSFCLAIDSSGGAFTYNSTSWTPAQSIGSTGAFKSVSCTSSGFCVAITSDGGAFTYNGTSWTPAQSIDPSGAFKSVLCTSSGFCVAITSDGGAFTYGSQHFSVTVTGRVSTAGAPVCQALKATLAVVPGQMPLTPLVSVQRVQAWPVSTALCS